MRRAFLSMGACLALVLMAGASAADDEEHFLDYSEDNFKVVFISGNFTAAVTHDWPMVVFQHTTNLFAPTFEVGLPAFYLFNDTNGDGVFSRSEAAYISYMDAHHNVTWNNSGVAFMNATAPGEYAEVVKNATLSLYATPDDLEAAVVGWANVTFRFTITENAVQYANSHGTYAVRGKTELRMSFLLEILKPVNQTFMALEQLLKGGGSNYMFLIQEDSGGDAPNTTWVSSREDDTVYGENFTRRLNQTDLPCQQIEFAKDDGTVQAFYNYSSEPLSGTFRQQLHTPMNSSFYTTGSGMILHTAYALTNDTKNVAHESSLGIDEAGFVSRVRDWFEKNLPLILVFSGSVAAAISLTILVYMIRKYRKGDVRHGPKGPEPPAA